MSPCSASAARPGVPPRSATGSNDSSSPSDAVGEVLVAPFDLDGAFVCPALRERVIAFDARRLGDVPVAIGVAAGEAKVRPILGALRAGIVRTLVTDVATAEAVVALAEDGTRAAAAPRPTPRHGR